MDIKQAIAIVAERKLHLRVKAESEGLDRWFAYCVEDDTFCESDVSYTDYTTKHYICFSREPDGTFIYGIPFEEHTPLLMKATGTQRIFMEENHND